MMERHAAQACVGVHEAVAAECNEQMVLRRTRRGEDEVAPHYRACRGDEPSALGEGEMPRDAAVAQRVTIRRLRFERAGDQTDAVKPRRRITAAEPEGRAEKAFRCRGKGVGGHLGIG